MAPPTPLSLHRSIPWPYTLYFLYLDPLFAIFGTLLIIFNPVKFLTSTSPLPLASSISIALSQPTIAPIIQLLLTNIAALYLLLALNEGLVLRASSQIRVWKAVLVSLVVADVGHLYAVWAAAPERLTVGMMGEWTGDEWVNVGILTLGLCLRISFLAGIGVKPS